jgi:hypothetical protein
MKDAPSSEKPERKRPDPPLSNRRVGTCHDATGAARHDRRDSYQKTDDLPSLKVPMN